MNKKRSRRKQKKAQRTLVRQVEAALTGSTKGVAPWPWSPEPMKPTTAYMSREEYKDLLHWAEIQADKEKQKAQRTTSEEVVLPQPEGGEPASACTTGTIY